MMQRIAVHARERMLGELRRDLSPTAFDLLVVGGGVTGAGIARDAALRGWRVALLEREDFASGTSSRSSRLVHGGLRYLEHGHIRLVFESSRERRILLRIAPHLVRPLQFIWPVYEGARVPAWKLRAGLLLYDTLSLFRGIAPHAGLPPERIAAMEPSLRRQGLVAGARYHDAATDDSRLTLATVRAAADAGAIVLNHVEVAAFPPHGDSTPRALVRDHISGVELVVEASIVINAAGPWSDEVRSLADPVKHTGVRGTKGAHIAVPRERVGNNGAVTILSPIDGRVMFVLPAGHLTIIGTTESEYSGSLASVRASIEDVRYLLLSANAYFPDAHLSSADVVSAWAGVRPLTAHASGSASGASREHSITWTTPTMLSVTGGKLTTYRSMAAEAVDEAEKRLPQAGRRTRGHTDRLRLPGGEMQSLSAELDAARMKIRVSDVASRLVHSYGSEWRIVWSMATAAGGGGATPTRLAPPLPFLTAELRYAVEREMAVTLSDILIRRVPIAFECADHGWAVARRAANLVAPLLGWTPERIEQEIELFRRDVDRIFSIEGAEQDAGGV